MTWRRRRSVLDHTPTTALPRVGARHRLAVLRHPLLRDLEHGGRGGVPGEVVLPPALVARALAHVDRVERGPQIDEERVVTLSHEHLRAVAQGLDRLVDEVLVVRERLRPDVRRRHGELVGNLLRVLHPPVLQRLPDQVVALNHVQARIVKVLCTRARIEERVRVSDIGLELEQVPDVGNAVAGVVDAHVVPRPVVEPEEVRTVGRNLARDPVRRDRQRVGPVLGRECVDVGVVGRWIEGDVWRLPVTRAEPQRDRDRRGRNRSSHDPEAFVWRFPHLPGTPFWC